MKNIKLIFMVTLILFLAGNLHAQIKATTSDGEKVVYNSETNSWKYVDTMKSRNKDASKISTENLRSIITKKGETSFAELKAIYLSQSSPYKEEVEKIFDEIYSKSELCDCIVCSYPSHCTWADDCREAENVPCYMCCD